MKHLPFGVNLSGHLHSEKGVGEVSRCIVQALTAAGIPYSLNDVRDPGSTNIDRRLPSGNGEHNPYSVNLLAFNAAGVAEFSRFHGREYFQDRVNIGFWNWELRDFPREWFPSFRLFDEIWVPSLFTAQAIAGVSPVPVRRIPLAVSAGEPSTPVTREELGLQPDTFVFLFALDFQSIVARKNPSAVVEAFQRAFGKREDVALVLKVIHPDANPEVSQKLGSIEAEAPNIRIVDALFERSRMLGLLEMMDCYISLHRSEGFGLLMAEAMSIGKPVIATGYSGNMDFMTTENSLLIDCDVMPIKEDHGPYFKGTVWADPDIDHAATLMKRITQSPDLASELGRRAAADIAVQLAPDTIGQQIARRLQDLAGQLHPDQVAVSLRRLQEPPDIPLDNHRRLFSRLVRKIKSIVRRWHQATRQGQFEFNVEVGDVISRLSARVRRQEEQLRELQKQIEAQETESTELANTSSGNPMAEGRATGTLHEESS